MDLDAFRAPLGAPEKMLHFFRSLHYFYEDFRANWNAFVANRNCISEAKISYIGFQKILYYVDFSNLII